jgi:hypothetical protein
MNADLITFSVFHALVLLCVVPGLLLALVGWAGARTGVVLGALICLTGIGSLVFTLCSAWARLWWLSVPPIYAGWLTMSAWRARLQTAPRSPFRFTLGGLAVFVFTLCALMGGIAVYFGQQRAEESLIAELDPQSAWVNNWAFGRVDSVSLNIDSDEGLAKALATLRQLHGLRELWINDGTGCSGGVTQQLRDMTTLEVLYLRTARLGNADLKPLGGLQRLDSLHLNVADLTDEGLQYLYPLKHLKKLDIYNRDPRKISRQGLQRLCSELPQLDLGDYRPGMKRKAWALADGDQQN